MTLDRVLTAHARSIGAHTVDRVLPQISRRHVGPYIFLDHLGPVVQAPGDAFAVAAHPHIGLSTLTYLLAGELVHRDSLGTVQSIHPGEVNWMTSGRGITHTERVPPHFAAAGGLMHFLQLWVGLTAEHEDCEPEFQHIAGPDLPVVDLDHAVGRLIAGTAYGLTSPLRVHSPQFCVHLQLAAGARVPLPQDHEERAAYIVDGRLAVDGADHGPRNLLVFLPGGEPVIEAAADSVVLLLGGAKIPAPHMWWNFVSTRKDRIEQAKQDWAAGRFLLPPGDDQEVIPLPEDRAPRPEPMS
jgi:redox-sensitive bicupin YhaK (pirin superfamily)